MRAINNVLTSDLKIHIATGFWQRARGLLGLSSIDIDYAMLFPNCNSVHTVGMRFAIDVVFIDKAGRILKLVSSLPPMRIAHVRGAAGVLELAAGQAARRICELEQALFLINQPFKEAS